MCDPVTGAALAGSAVASGLQIAGQNQAQRAQINTARQAVQQQEMRQQEGIDAARGEIAAYNPSTLRTSADGATERRAAYYAPSVVSQPGAAPLAGMTTSATQNYLDALRGRVAAYQTQQAGAKARLGGLADAFVTAGQAQQRGSERIARTSNFAAGDLSTLQPKLNAAAYKGQGLRTAGDLLGVASVLAPAAGGAFGGAPGAESQGFNMRSWGNIFGRGGMKGAA